MNIEKLLEMLNFRLIETENAIKSFEYNIKFLTNKIDNMKCEVQKIRAIILTLKECEIYIQQTESEGKTNG